MTNAPKRIRRQHGVYTPSCEEGCRRACRLTVMRVVYSRRDALIYDNRIRASVIPHRRQPQRTSYISVTDIQLQISSCFIF